MIDTTDMEILRELEKNSKRKIHQLATVLRYPRSTIHNRIRRMEELGIIKTYKAIVDHSKIGRPVTSFVHIVITSKQSAHGISEKLKNLPFVEEVHVVAGQYDIIAKVRFKDTNDLGKFIFDAENGLRTMTGIDRTETMIVVNTEKEYGLVQKTK